jgi:hypothetical protein
MFSIQKFTLGYNPLQDRVSLSASNAEGEVIVLWLTQRLLNQLTQTLMAWLDDELKAATSGRVIPELHAFEQSAALSVYKPEKPVSAAESPEESLITTIDLSHKLNGFQLVFRWDAAGAARLFMDSVQLRQFMGILFRVVEMAGWPKDSWPDWFSAETDMQSSSMPPLLH